MKLLYATLLSLALLGCDSSNGESDDPTPKSVAEVNYEMWNDASQTSYSFIYEETGFSPLQGKWEIQVHNDEVIFVNYTGKNTQELSLDTSTAPSIDTLFEEVLSEVNEGCTVTENIFDGENYFPSKFSVFCISEEVGFVVTDFVVQ